MSRVKILSICLLVVNALSTPSSHKKTCVIDSECSTNGWYTCQEGFCHHKLIWPMTEMEFWGLVLVAFTLFYTSLAGVSGGGLVIPVAISFFGFDASNAIALSNFSIFVASATRFITFSGEPHPLKHGKGLLVDHNLAVLGLPWLIMGVSFGVLMNIMVPPVITLSVFVIICLYLAYSMYDKARVQYAKENEERELTDGKSIENPNAVYPENDETMAEGGSALNTSYEDKETNALVTTGGDDDEYFDVDALEKIIEAESTNFQPTKLALNYSLIGFLVLISFMKGADKSSDSWLGLKKCDSLDWGLFAALQVICLIYFAIGYCVVNKELQQKQQLSYEFVEGDFRMTSANLCTIVLLAFVGSLLAAWSGIGPGFVFGGGLAIIGLESRVAMATGMYLTTLMTMSSSIQLLAMKKIKLDYLKYVVVMTLLGALPGMFFQSYVVTVTGRSSTTIFILSSCLIVAVVGYLGVSVMPLITTAEEKGTLFEMGSYC